MKKTLLPTWAAKAFLLCCLTACSQKEISTGDLNVIPLPQEVAEAADAAPFVINSSTVICYPEGNEKLERTARFLASYIKEVTGTEVKVSTKGGKTVLR